MKYEDDEYAIPGIYKILNTVNNKVYIGSSMSIFDRWKEHIRSLRKGNHHSRHLQNAWNLYGEKSFLFCIIENCDKDELLDREQFYIDAYNSADSRYGYNICDNVKMPFLSKNILEMNSKLRGENRYQSLYSDNQIKELIEYLKTGEYSHIELSKMLNISYSVVTSVVKHNSWTHLTDGIEFPEPNKFKRENVKLTEIDVVKIIKMLNDGKTNIEISDIFKVHPKTISDIRNHKTWKEYTEGMEFIPGPVIKEFTPIQKKIIECYKNNPNEDYKVIAKNINASESYVNHYLNKLKNDENNIEEIF